MQDRAQRISHDLIEKGVRPPSYAAAPKQHEASPRFDTAKIISEEERLECTQKLMTDIYEPAEEQRTPQQVGVRQRIMEAILDSDRSPPEEDEVRPVWQEASLTQTPEQQDNPRALTQMMKDNLYNVLQSNKILKRPKATLQMVPNRTEEAVRFSEMDVLSRQ